MRANISLLFLYSLLENQKLDKKKKKDEAFKSSVPQEPPSPLNSLQEHLEVRSSRSISKSSAALQLMQLR